MVFQNVWGMGDDHLTKARYLGGSGVSADADRAWGSRTISNEINVNLPLGDRSSGKRRYQEIESHRDFEVAPSTSKLRTSHSMRHLIRFL
jgi:hypothetical protein